MNIEEINNANTNNDIIIYWMLELININRVKFDDKLWNNKIKNKIDEYNKLYQIEKLKNKKTNLFIEDND